MLRIGKIDYTNTFPVFYHFCENDFAGEVEVIPQVPAVLNRQMAEGKVDLGPISSFAYAVHHEEYLLLPDLSVSALGPVRSILFFTKKPLDSYRHMHVALTNTSATSVHLLKILLQEFLHISADYRTMKPNLREMMNWADGALLIGDDAIAASWKDHGYHAHDLGELWYRFTGQWMTFALWAVRKEIYQRQKDLLYRIYLAFQASKERSRQDLSPVLRLAMERVGGDRNYWETYFKGLSHDFGPEQIQGLKLYYQLAKKWGFLTKDVEIRVIDDWFTEKSMSGV